MNAKRKQRARPRPTLELVLQYAAPRIGLPQRRSITSWIDAAIDRDARITLRIVGTREARALNRRYRNRDYATNVLSFPYTRTRALVEGDIVLCAPVIAREARARRKLTIAHYAHLVVHGVLHLGGFDHERARAALRMERREQAILARLGYPDPYSS